MLILVEQNEHGRLAGEFARHWGNAQFAKPERADSVILGASMHDEGWRQPDAAPLFNQREQRPLYFLEIEREDHVALYRQGVERAFTFDLYAGLLVSMHWTGLYRARWGMQSGAVAFNEQTALKKLQDEAVAAEEERWISVKRELLQGVRRSEFEAALWYSYDLIQAWDVLSLYMSMSDLSVSSETEVHPLISKLYSIDQVPGPRAIESVPTRIGGERVNITLTAIHDNVVVLEPYPFDTDSLDFQLIGKALPDRAYEDPQAVHEALSRAQDYTIRCQMKRRR